MTGGNPNKQKGSNFEYRNIDNFIKLGFIKVKRQAYSGASKYAEDKGDVTASLHYFDFMNYDFLIECKKTSLKKFTFNVEWISVTAEKAAKMVPARIPIVSFSGNRMPIFIMMEKKIFYKLFGNYNQIVIREYKTRNGKSFTLNWPKILPLMKGQVNEKSMLKIVEFDKLNGIYMMELSEMKSHLDKISEKYKDKNF